MADQFERQAGRFVNELQALGRKAANNQLKLARAYRDPGTRAELRQLMRDLNSLLYAIESEPEPKGGV